MPTVKPRIASPDEGETFSIGELRIVSRVQGNQSGGGLELYELVLGRFVIDYHVHHTMDETLSSRTKVREFKSRAARVCWGR